MNKKDRAGNCRGGQRALRRLSAVALTALLAVPAEAQIKSWTDEKGVTHYGKEIP